MSQVLDALEKIQEGRQDSYGNPEDSFTLIADLWSSYLNSIERNDLTRGDVARLMILLKVARTIGNHDKLDNYVDIAGYASIAGDLQFNEPIEGN